MGFLNIIEKEPAIAAWYIGLSGSTFLTNATCTIGLAQSINPVVGSVITLTKYAKFNLYHIVRCMCCQLTVRQMLEHCRFQQ